MLFNRHVTASHGILLCITLSTMLVISGCSRNIPSPTVSASSGSVSLSGQEDNSTEEWSECTLLVNGTQNQIKRSTENGFYDVSIRNDGQCQIFYTDYATKVQIPLCASPNCDHNSSECLSIADTNSLFVYNDKLYQFYQGYDAPQHLKCMNLDGSNSEILLELKENEYFPVGGVAAADNYLYFAIVEIDDNANQTYQIVSFDLESKTITPIQSSSQEEFIMDVSEDKLIIKRFSLDEDTWKPLEPEFLMLTQDGQEVPINLPSWVNANTFIYPTDGSLYIHDNQAGRFVKQNILTGECTTIFENEIIQNVSSPLIIADAKDDGLVWSVGEEYYLYKDGKFVHSNFSYYRSAKPSNKILDTFGDSYLVCRDYDTIPKTLTLTPINAYWMDDDSKDVKIQNSQ